MITLSHLAWACFILACLLFTAYILYFLADDRPRHRAGRHQARVNEFGPEPGEEWADELHQIGDDTGRMAALCLPGRMAALCLPGPDGPLPRNADRAGSAGRAGELYVTGPVPAQADPLTGPVTRNPRDRAWWETAGVTAATAAAAKVPGPVAGHHPVHSIEVHPRDYWAGQYRDGLNARTNCWPMGEGDLDESAWTKRSALDLRIQVAYDDTAAGFDQLLREVRNFGDYAASGLQPRWTEVA